MISPSSALVAASDSLVLENEQILKLFPKCRPRSQNETMNQFYASIKEQHQPPMSAASGAGGGVLSNASAASKTTSYSGGSGSNNKNSAMKKLITDPSMMVLGSGSGAAVAANSMPFGGISSSADYKTYANKKERAMTTNPFLTNNNSSESQQQRVEQHSSSSSRGQLTHSQSDCGVCYVGGGGGAGVGLIGANNSSSPFPASASVSSQLSSSSNCNTEMMSKNFQRHMKNSNPNPLQYQSNPFIGAAHKLDEYEEEQLNIIVQDQQQAAPEYYFDRRTVRPQSAVTPPLVVHQSSHHKGYTAVPTNHSALHGMRSTTVESLLHSPELKENRETTVYNNYTRDHHYLNVGRSPVNSNAGDQLNEEEEHEEMMNQGLYLEKRSPEVQKSVRSNHHRGSPAPALHADSHRSSTQFASKKRNKSVAVVSEGEVVIFDDIEESWYNLKVKPESIGEGHVYRQNFIADPDPVSPDRNSLDASCGGEDDQVTSTAAEVATVPARGVGGGSSVAGMVIGK